MIATPSRFFLVVLCCLVILCYAVYLGAVGVLLPFVGAAFHLETEAQGRLFPANFAGFVIGVLLCGYLSDRGGRKLVLLAGIAIYGLGLALLGSASAFWQALVASALVGAGSGAMEVVASALAADLYPEKRAFLLNAVQVAFGAGAAVAPTLVRYLLTHGTPWRTLYLGLALSNAVLFALLLLPRVPRASGGETVALGELLRLLRQPVVAVLCLSQGLYVGGEVSFFSWMPTYFERQLPSGAAWAGWVVTLFWAAMTIGRFVTGGLLERLPLPRLNFYLGLGGMLFAALALVGRAPLPVMACVALAGLCFSGIFGIVLAEATERFPQVAGTIMGAVVASGGLGGAILPWAVGALAESPVGWQGGLGLIPLAMGGVAALSWRLGRWTNA